jgi:hypothetical protein
MNASAAVMSQRIMDRSPGLMARVAGVLYLIIIVVAGYSEFFVRDRLIVSGDAAATATNILGHEALYRLGGAAVPVYLACDTAVALLFYKLFKPVSGSLSLLAAFFRLVMVAILGVNLLNHFAPLILLKDAHFSEVFNADQLQALARVSLRLYRQGFDIAMVFFGFHCILIGYLIFKAAFLPRILGVLMAVAGLWYLTNSFTIFLSPSLARVLFPLIPLILAGELGLTLWLLVKGVNVQQWNKQASLGR